MKKIVITLILLVFLNSCSKNEKTIIVNTLNAEGITTETKLDVNGLEIGQVTQLKIVKNGTVDLICRIENKDIEIPTDSKFYARDSGLLGNKAIGIRMGSKKELLKNGMKVEMQENNPNQIEDTFSKAINQVMSVFSGQHKTDSLLFELRRLNKNLEELKLELKK